MSTRGLRFFPHPIDVSKILELANLGYFLRIPKKGFEIVYLKPTKEVIEAGKENFLSDEELENVEFILNSFVVLPDGKVVGKIDFEVLKKEFPVDSLCVIEEFNLEIKKFLAIDAEKIRNSKALGGNGFLALVVWNYLKELESKNKDG